MTKHVEAKTHQIKFFDDGDCVSFYTPSGEYKNIGHDEWTAYKAENPSFTWLASDNINAN